MAESALAFLQLGIGFALAGAVAIGYQLLTHRPVSFRLLQRGPIPAAFAAVPLLMFAAPFVIMRSALRDGFNTGRQFQSVFAATMVAGFWSLMSGTVVAMAFQVAVG